MDTCSTKTKPSILTRKVVVGVRLDVDVVGDVLVHLVVVVEQVLVFVGVVVVTVHAIKWSRA